VKATISSYSDKRRKLSTVKKVCSYVVRTGSAVLRKPGIGRPSLSLSVGRPYQISKYDKVNKLCLPTLTVKTVEYTLQV